MSDLGKLIEAVERGDADVNMCASAFPSESAYGKCRWHIAWEAYRGSLDAANAVHEALLPGWFWTVGDINASVSKHPVWVTEHAGGGPARAWLLAILRAYAAQQAADAITDRG